MSGNVVLQTSMGEIEIELYWDHAPVTCKNFHTLAKKGFYDNTIFHRVVKNFLIQGGDPTGTGRGGTSIYGDRFPDEISLELKHTGAGILSMANHGPNSNGSQFFITLCPCPHLDGTNSIFGRVKRGMGVVRSISVVETDKFDRPKEDIRVNKAIAL